MAGQQARGFNTTLGVGSTDTLVAPTKGVANQQTFACFFLFRAATGVGMRILSAEDATNFVRVFARDPAGNYSFEHSWTGSAGGVAIWNLVTQPTDGVWHQGVVAYDTGSTNAPTIWIDKVVQSLTTVAAASGSPAPPSDNFKIGNNSAGGVRVWDGLIARVFVDDGILWSQTQVNSHYCTGDPGVSTEIALAATTASLTNTGSAGGSFTATGTAMNSVNNAFFPTCNQVAFQTPETVVAGLSRRMVLPSGFKPGSI